MALQIRDSHIDAMVSELQSLTQARTRQRSCVMRCNTNLREFVHHCT